MILRNPWSRPNTHDAAFACMGRTKQSPPRVAVRHFHAPPELLGIPYSRLNRRRWVPRPAHRLNPRLMLTFVNNRRHCEIRWPVPGRVFSAHAGTSVAAILAFFDVRRVIRLAFVSRCCNGAGCWQSWIAFKPGKSHPDHLARWPFRRADRRSVRLCRRARKSPGCAAGAELHAPDHEPGRIILPATRNVFSRPLGLRRIGRGSATQRLIRRHECRPWQRWLRVSSRLRHGFPARPISQPHRPFQGSLRQLASVAAAPDRAVASA